MKKRRNKKAQVWVETIIYTLIALTMIGLVLSFVKPKIEEMQDKATIDQSIGMIKELDSIILEVVLGGAGNKRKVDLGIKKGVLKINADNDTIIFEMNSAHTYSEPGIDIYDEELLIHTEKKGKLNLVTLTMDYAGKYDLKIGGGVNKEIINKASLPYKLFISNKGKDEDKTIIDMEVK